MAKSHLFKKEMFMVFKKKDLINVISIEQPSSE